MDSYDWIIGICCTEADGVRLYRFRGTIEEAKEKLVSLVAEDRGNDEDNWDYGTEDTEEVDAVDNGLGYELYASGVYFGYHIDYTAKEFAHIDNI